MNPSPLWEFSLAFYAAPGVAEACLRLQDAHGVDVNVLLYVLFLGRRGRRLDGPALDRIEALAKPWRDAVVRPLRSVRRALKTPLGGVEPALSANLRSEVKRIELDAEHLQQLTLEGLAPASTLGSAHADPAACVRDNLALYAARHGVFPAELVERLLRHCGPASASA
ncbi:MAG: TIGR02444 family protein [Burkholderiales bacterium]|nr:TIGR02444 family protein [Burkholderiales bacterium]